MHRTYGSQGEILWRRIEPLFPLDPDAGYVRPHAEIHDDLLKANIETYELQRKVEQLEELLAFRQVDVQKIQRLIRFETYVCQVIAMGDQARLTVEELPK